MSSARKRLTRRQALTLLGLVLAAGLVALVNYVSETFSPSDWVELSIDGLQREYRPILVVGQTEDRIFALNWYVAKVWPAVLDARRGPFGTSADKKQFNYAVQWLEARRYAVLAKDKSGTWTIWWLTGGNARVQWRWCVLGASYWKIDLTKEAPEKPSDELLKAIGELIVEM